MIKDCLSPFERKAIIMMRLSYRQAKDIWGINRWLYKLALGDVPINAIRKKCVLRNEKTAARHRHPSPSVAAVPIYGV